MSSWNQHFMDMAILISTRSKDPARQVGAVIIDSMRRVQGAGYNGFPRNVRDLPERYDDEFVKLKLIVHAEVNAILNSHLHDLCTLFSTSYPCSECTKLILQTGISTVVSPGPTVGKWRDDAEFSKQMMI